MPLSPQPHRQATGGRPGRAPGPSVRAALVLLAAGSGTRVGAEVNKVLLPLAGRQVLSWSLTWTAELPQLGRTVIVARAGDEAEIAALVAREQPGRAVDIVPGGDTRHASEYAAVRRLAPAIRAGELDVVAIHDAARPLSGTRVFADVVDAALAHGGALPVLAQPGLVALDSALPPTADLVTVQTPQAFRATTLLAAYERAAETGFEGTDTAACVERLGALPIHGLPGTASNIKITFSEDLLLAERILAAYDWQLP